ncbi:MAG: hypothetical protein BYD32DRAFT_163011 [Podila humilis]|nr:MAG: hypothetical protein BYD32DRAFT_163011 [Podila humilis]
MSLPPLAHIFFSCLCLCICPPPPPHGSLSLTHSYFHSLPAKELLCTCVIHPPLPFLPSCLLSLSPFLLLSTLSHLVLCFCISLPSLSLSLSFFTLPFLPPSLSLFLFLASTDLME